MCIPMNFSFSSDLFDGCFILPECRRVESYYGHFSYEFRSHFNDS